MKQAREAMGRWYLAAQGSNTQSKKLLAGSPGSLTPISALKYIHTPC